MGSKVAVVDDWRDSLGLSIKEQRRSRMIPEPQQTKQILAAEFWWRRLLEWSMKEVLWLRLRNSPLLRRLYVMQDFAHLMKSESYLLVQLQGMRIFRVAGVWEGLLFASNPRWEIPN
jgi:hypothetical protein